MNTAAWIVVAAVSALPQRPAPTALDRAPPAERRLPSAGIDGASLENSLLRSALVAAGADSPCRIAELNDRYEEWLELVASQQPELPAPTRAKTAEIFARLHAEVLTGEYRADCSDVGVTLETGDFNCLTATILFLCAARYFHLDVQAMAVEGHVFCETRGDGLPRKIETTCARWFELAAFDAAAAHRMAAGPRGSDRRPARPLSDAQLIAKVYYNRGVASLRAGDFQRGLELTRLSLQLDPHDGVARGNVLAGLNNWSLSLCRQGEFARAVELIDELRRLDPHYPTLEENTGHIHRCWSRQRINTPGGHLPPSALQTIH